MSDRRTSGVLLTTISRTYDPLADDRPYPRPGARNRERVT